MSLDLEAQIKSLKITDETLHWLRWIAACEGRSHAEIAREALHAVAIKAMDDVVHKFNVLNSLKPREGSIGEAPGKFRLASEK